jgi:hypothetical protein
MHWTTSSKIAIFGLTALTGAVNISDNADGDAKVWEALEGVSKRSPSEVTWNRPVKRQSGWSPPSSLVTPLKQVWDHCLSTYSNGLFGFKNYGWDQIMATQGCVLPTKKKKPLCTK